MKGGGGGGGGAGEPEKNIGFKRGTFLHQRNSMVR